VLDCLKGLEQAVANGWYEFKRFDYKQYENFHKLNVGDMNWIVPGKILALSSPTSKKNDGLAPDAFLENFEKLKIKAVIRLNEPLYDESVFSKAGIAVHDMEFLDGSCPSDSVIMKFIELCDRTIESGGAVAVHCRAGLGRTGTLIGSYIVNKYGFSGPKSLIGWLRLARPGSVIGFQQDFLCDSFERFAKLNQHHKQSTLSIYMSPVSSHAHHFRPASRGTTLGESQALESTQHSHVSHTPQQLPHQSHQQQ
jgi:cell division cycle 14